MISIDAVIVAIRATDGHHASLKSLTTTLIAFMLTRTAVYFVDVASRTHNPPVSIETCLGLLLDCSKNREPSSQINYFR